MTRSHVYIHGTHGKPRPRLEFADHADIPLAMTGTSDRLEYVGIHNTLSLALVLDGGSTAAQIYVRADMDGETDYTCQITNGTWSTASA